MLMYDAVQFENWLFVFGKHDEVRAFFNKKLISKGPIQEEIVVKALDKIRRYAENPPYRAWPAGDHDMRTFFTAIRSNRID